MDYHTHDGQCQYDGKARLLRSQEDMALIKAFFSERCFFDKNVKDPHGIMNIETGMIAPPNRDAYYPVLQLRNAVRASLQQIHSFSSREHWI